MSVLKVMMRHVGYYILTIMLISSFTSGIAHELLMTVCGAAVFISMFAAVIQLFFDGSVGAGAQKVSEWCLRGTAVTTGIAVISSIGISNIAKLFGSG